jgi:uncharacterized protein
MSTPIMGKTDVVARLANAEPRLRELGVSRLALFGSFVRGDERPDSDIDLLVDFIDGSKSFTAFMSLAFFLEELLGRRVELVTVEALSPYIGPRILSEAEDVVRAA